MCVEIERPTLKCIEKYKGKTQNNQHNLERKVGGQNTVRGCVTGTKTDKY